MAPLSYEQQVAELLAQPDAEIGQVYLSEVCQRLGCADNVEVRSAGPDRGKGIFVKKQFKRGDAIFQERPLVAIQHASSAAQSLVCSHCFRFLGTIEEQVARKLQYTLRRVEGLQQQQQQQQQQQHHAQHGSDPGAGPSSSSAPAPAPAAAASACAGTSAGTAGGEGEEPSAEAEVKEVDPDEVAEVERRVELIVTAGVDAALLEELAAGRKHLPLSHKFPLPKPVPCRSGCGAAYCGAACEEAAWKLHHRLLCPSEPTPAAADQQGACDPQTSSAHDQQPQATGGALHADKAALGAFYRHAASTNEIFGLAAKVLAVTVVRAEALRQRRQGEGGTPAEASERSGEGAGAGEGGGFWPAALLAADAALQKQRGDAAAGGSGADACGSSSGAGEQGTATRAAAVGADAGAGQAGCSSSSGAAASASPDNGGLPCGEGDWAALKAAWLPFASGWKRVWWESVAVPPDVDDEAAFRQQLRSLATRSLRLLRQALPAAAARFPPLFSAEVYGAVVGMFELNNLSLTVPTPVEDYFLLIDDLPEAEKAAAQVDTQPLLDALDKAYDEPCEGTAFYALQSCANHSCVPGATIEGEASGEASILALTTIRPGEEVTISYIDEEQGYRDRQAALRDYGFKCCCKKCEADKAGARKTTGKRKASKK